MKWILSRLEGMWLVILSPQETFVRNQSGPSYLVPFIILSLIYLALTAIQMPIQLAWMQAQVGLAGSAAGKTAAGMALYERTSHLALVSVPVLLILRWLIHALLVWLVAQVFLLGPGFSKTLVVVAYAYTPVILRDATVCFILCLRDRELLMQADGLYVALGLNLVFPRLPLPWWVLVGNVNLFELWFVALLVTGLAALGKMRWHRSLAVVLPVWLFTVLIQFGITAFSYRLKGQLGGN